MNKKERSLEDKIRLAGKWMGECKKLVAFTGAGISTESGLPDFRGPDGVWTRRDKGLPPKPGPSWHTVDPNSAHIALVDLQNLGILKYLISQNVDGLHLKSGIKNDILAELHGNSTLMKCLKCHSKFTFKEAGWDKKIWGRGYRTYKVKKDQPTCPKCKGRIINSVVNFGDPMPDREMELSEQHSSTCDVFLAIGSSLQVSPACYMPDYALENNAKLILINMGETPFDKKANIRIYEKAGEVLPQMVAMAKTIRSRT